MSCTRNLSLATGLLAASVGCDPADYDSVELSCNADNWDLDGRDIDPKDVEKREAMDDHVFEDLCYAGVDFREQFVDPISARVALSVHLVLYDGVSVDELRDEVREQVAILNQLFAEVGLEFYVTNIDEVMETDPSVFSGVKSGPRLLHDYGPHDDPNNDFINVLMIPKVDFFDGYAYLGRFNLGVYYSVAEKNGEKRVDVRDSYTLAHEMGHYFYLRHPFDHPEVGDFLKGTVDYSKVCYDGERTSVVNYVEDGVCIKACGDGCYAAPLNLMDYGHCGDVLPTLNHEQVTLIRCFAETRPRMKRLLNSGLPEVEL